MAKLVDVGSIASYFHSLDDPRHTRNRRHLLVDIAVIAVCAIVCGCDGPTAIHRWARHRQYCLAEYLALPNGIPSRDCIRRLLVVLKPRGLPTLFPGLDQRHDRRPTSSSPDRLVAIDGKSLSRLSRLRPRISVRCTSSAPGPPKQGIALGQVATDAKSNEITAIPATPGADRSEGGTLITIDAMGCQKEIVKQVVAGGGDCVIAVKDNQPTLAGGDPGALLRSPGRTT